MPDGSRGWMGTTYSADISWEYNGIVIYCNDRYLCNEKMNNIELS